VVAPVLLVLAATGGGVVLTRIEAARDSPLVLAVGLAAAAVAGALAATAERRRRALREVERLFALSPELVIVAGFDGYWKRVNPSVETVLGYSERESLTRPFMDFVHPDDRERTEEEARRVVGGETATAFTNRILHKDGSHCRMLPKGWPRRSRTCRRSRVGSTQPSSRRGVLPRRCERSRTARRFP